MKLALFDDVMKNTIAEFKKKFIVYYIGYIIIYLYRLYNIADINYHIIYNNFFNIGLIVHITPDYQSKAKLVSYHLGSDMMLQKCLGCYRVTTKKTL